MIKIKWQKKFRKERVYSGYEFKDKVHCDTKGREPVAEEGYITISMQKMDVQ